jgi:hypothetical protein
MRNEISRHCLALLQINSWIYIVNIVMDYIFCIVKAVHNIYISLLLNNYTEFKLVKQDQGVVSFYTRGEVIWLSFWANGLTKKSAERNVLYWIGWLLHGYWLLYPNKKRVFSDHLQRICSLPKWYNKIWVVWAKPFVTLTPFACDVKSYCIVSVVSRTFPACWCCYLLPTLGTESV